MDANFQAILDSLPPKLPRSKLDPYVDLIRELRKRQRSYREITGILKERCGLSVGVHTLYSFVRTRGIPGGVDQQASRSNPVIGDTQHPFLGRGDAADIVLMGEPLSGREPASLRQAAQADTVAPDRGLRETGVEHQGLYRCLLDEL